MDKQLTDEAILADLGQRLARQRLDRGLTQAALAERAGVAKRTLERAEAGESVQMTTLVRILRALDLLGALDAAIPPAGTRPLDLLQRGKPRQRASSRQRQDMTGEPWSWGDDGGGDR